MHNFSIEISIDDDGKIINLDVDDMQINIYQRQAGEMVRIFEIDCSMPGAHPIGTLLTAAEFVGENDDVQIKMESSGWGKVVKALSNKYAE